MKKVVAVLVVCLGATVALAGSPAHQAKLTIGDVNLDQVVDQYDVLAILDWQSGLVSLNDVQLAQGDLTADGVVDLDDAAMLLGRLQVDDKTIIRRVQVTVDPTTGVQETVVFNPLESLQSRVDSSDKAAETRDTSIPGNMPWLVYNGGACPDCLFSGGSCPSRTVDARFSWNDPAPSVNQMFPNTIVLKNVSLGGSAASVDPFQFLCDVSPPADCLLIENGETFRIRTVVNLTSCNSFTIFYDFTATVDVD